MVNEMRELLQDAAATMPGDDIDLAEVVRTGRRRVRRRRTAVGGGIAVMAVGAVAAGALVTGPDGLKGDNSAAAGVPRPDGPVLRLADAAPAREGVDYDVLLKHTNKSLNARNGQYFSGVTDDGLLFLQDGPHGIKNRIRYALVDPATGAKDWLPQLDEREQTGPVALGADRLVLTSYSFDQTADLADSDLRGTLVAHVYDRATRTWSTRTWTGLPEVNTSRQPVLGPDGRLYVGIPATQGSPPPGGWPIGPDGEADDANAEGDTYDLWSASLTDPADVRDEHLRVGSVAFTDEVMVWSARTNGKNDRIHVRDLATGKEHDFDPKSGKRCNLLGFGVTGERIMLSQYCGTYDDGRDDRVQVLDLDGTTVTTIQGDGIMGMERGGLVQVSSYAAKSEGTYVYEPTTGRFLQATDKTAMFNNGGGPVAEGDLVWSTPYGEAQGPADSQDPDVPAMDKGATDWLVRWHS